MELEAEGAMEHLQATIHRLVPHWEAMHKLTILQITTISITIMDQISQLFRVKEVCQLSKINRKQRVQLHIMDKLLPLSVELLGVLDLYLQV